MTNKKTEVMRVAKKFKRVIDLKSKELGIPASDITQLVARDLEGRVGDYELRSIKKKRKKKVTIPDKPPTRGILRI